MVRLLLELNQWKFLIIEIIVFAFMILAVCQICFRINKKTALRKTILQGANTLVQNMDCGEVFYLLMKKENQEVMYISNNTEKLFGLKAEEIERNFQALSQIMEAGVSRRIRKEAAEYVRQGEAYSTEFPYHHLNGSETFYAMLHIGCEDENQTILVEIHDITEEYKKREELLEELKQEKIANQSKSVFLSQMSHEIRTPMNGIMGMINLARDNMNDQKQADDFLEKADSLAKYLLSLINDVLDMSRIESGKVELEQEKFDLYEMGEKISAMFRKNIEEKGITYQLEMEDFDVRYVVGDEMRLTQVIINFISNSQKFTPEGGAITLTFRQMQKLDGKLHLLIRVRDTGKGMEAEFLSRIFKPFEQENTTIAKNYGGTGLGMAISDQLIELMGGQIVVESEVGKGSDFSVYIALPIAEGDQIMPWEEPEQKKQEQTSQSDGVQFQFRDSHVLLAEDNDINAKIAMLSLNALGAEVVRAVDGEDVVEKFAESGIGYFDVVLMDIQMPKMNGWDATIQIRALDREDAQKMPIIALSANAFVEDKRKSVEVGMNGHVSKPINFKELQMEIQKIIQN